MVYSRGSCHRGSKGGCLPNMFFSLIDSVTSGGLHIGFDLKCVPCSIRFPMDRLTKPYLHGNPIIEESTK